MSQSKLKLNEPTQSQTSNQSIGQYIGLSVSRWVGRTVGQAIKQSNQSIINQSINQSINQLASQSVSQSVSQPVNQSINQSLDYSTNRSLTQTIIILNYWLYHNKKMWSTFSLHKQFNVWFSFMKKCNWEKTVSTSPLRKRIALLVNVAAFILIRHVSQLCHKRVASLVH